MSGSPISDNTSRAKFVGQFNGRKCRVCGFDDITLGFQEKCTRICAIAMSSTTVTLHTAATKLLAESRAALSGNARPSISSWVRCRLERFELNGGRTVPTDDR